MFRHAVAAATAARRKTTLDTRYRVRLTLKRPLQGPDPLKA